MIICICKVVNHRTVEAEVAAGAHTLKEVSKRTGACTQCGRCKESLQACIDAANGSASTTSVSACAQPQVIAAA